MEVTVGIICLTALVAFKFYMDYRDRAIRTETAKSVIATVMASKLLAALDALIEEEVKRAVAKNETAARVTVPQGSQLLSDDDISLG
jgi:hypothetical protein